MDGRFLYYCGVGAGFFSRNDEAKSRSAKVHRSKTDGYETGTGTASEPFPTDWYLAGMALSCISQGTSPCPYQRRIAFTKLTTSNVLLYNLAGCGPPRISFGPVGT